MPRFLLLSFFLAVVFTAPSVSAMDFQVAIIKGEPAIIGTGKIIYGDAERLKSVLNAKSQHSMGYFALILNSSGGSVEAAFELSEVISSFKVHTYIAPGFECVSACAAIVFIAGVEHVVIPGGYLGFHGCYNSKNMNIIDLCNEKIAEHAIQHGTAYGSVMAFMIDTPYDKVIWISAKESNCWAISKYTISPKPHNYERCVFDMIDRMK